MPSSSAALPLRTMTNNSTFDHSISLYMDFTRKFCFSLSPFSKIKCSQFSSGSSKTFVRSWHPVIPFCLGCVGGKKKMGSLPDSRWRIIYQRWVQCYLFRFFAFFKQRQVCLWLLRRKFIKEDKTFSKFQGQYTWIHLKPKLLQVFHYILQRTEETSKAHLQGQTKAASYKERGAAQMSIIVGFLRLQGNRQETSTSLSCSH